jgi:hypothetical protein
MARYFLPAYFHGFNFTSWKALSTPEALSVHADQPAQKAFGSCHRREARQTQHRCNKWLTGFHFGDGGAAHTDLLTRLLQGIALRQPGLRQQAAQISERLGDFE